MFTPEKHWLEDPWTFPEQHWLEDERVLLYDFDGFLKKAWCIWTTMQQIQPEWLQP